MGRDGRTPSREAKFSGANGDRKNNKFPSSGDEQDWQLMNRTRLARPDCQAQTGTGKIPAGREQDWQPFPVDPYSAEYTNDTYMHTRLLQVLQFI